MIAETIISCAIVPTSVLSESAHQWLAEQGKSQNHVALAVCLHQATYSGEAMIAISGLVARYFLPLPVEIMAIWQRITFQQPVTMTEIRQALSLTGEKMEDFPPETETQLIESCCRVMENCLPSCRPALFRDAFSHPLLPSMPELEDYLVKQTLGSSDVALAEELVKRIAPYIDRVTGALTDASKIETLCGSDLPGLLAVSQALKRHWATLPLAVQRQIRLKLLDRPTEYVFPLALELLDGTVSSQKAGRLLGRWAVSLVSDKSWIRVRWDDRHHQIMGDTRAYLQGSLDDFMPLLAKADAATRAEFLAELDIFFGFDQNHHLVGQVARAAASWLQAEPDFRALLQPNVGRGKVNDQVLSLYVETYGTEEALPEVERWLAKVEPKSAWLIKILSIYQMGKHQLRPGLLLKDDFNGQKRDYLLDCGYQLQAQDVNSQEKVWGLLPKEHYYGGHKNGQSRWRLLYSKLWQVESWRTALLECGHLPEAVLASLLVFVSEGEGEGWLTENLRPHLDKSPSLWMALIDAAWCDGELKNGKIHNAPIWRNCPSEVGLVFIRKNWKKLSDAQQNRFKDYASQAFMSGSMPTVASTVLSDDEKRLLLFGLAAENNIWLPESLDQWVPLFTLAQPRLQLRNWLLRHVGKIRQGIYDERWLVWVEAFSFHLDRAFLPHIEEFFQDGNKDAAKHAARLLQAAKSSVS